MDFDNLLKLRETSKTIRDFIDDENQRSLWVSAMHKVQQETVDSFSLKLPEHGWPEQRCVDDHTKWIAVLQKVSSKGTIKDIILICNLMKKTENTMRVYGRFEPVKNLFSFYDTKLGFEELCYDTEDTEDAELVLRNFYLFKTWIRLDLETEEKLVEVLWDHLLEIVWKSNNSDSVLYFMDKMNAHDHMKFREDFKNLSLI